jgi:hypothetical protein
LIVQTVGCLCRGYYSPCANHALKLFTSNKFLRLNVSNQAFVSCACCHHETDCLLH